MVFTHRLITCILTFTILPAVFVFLYTKRDFLKKYRIFKDFLQIEEAYRKLKRRDYSVGGNVEFPLRFSSSVTIIFTLLNFGLFIFFLICILGRFRLDHSMNVENNIIFSAGFSLLFLAMAVFFLKQGRVTILKEDGIKTASHLKLLLTFGNFHYIAYHEIDSLKIRVVFGGGGLQSYSANCEVIIHSKKGELEFSANAGYTYDTLLLIVALKEKLNDKVIIVHNSRRRK